MSLLHQPRFLCVHVPEFPAQARLRHRPALRKQAFVVLDGTPPLETVCSTTRLARQRGVHHGTTRAELDSFPGVEALRRSRCEEESAAAALLAAVWQISPRVQALPVRNAAHRVVVDIAGTERIFGPPAQVARSVLQQVRALGMLAHLCVSDDFHTAVCVAPYAGARPAVISAGAERARLAPLPLSTLDGVEDEQREIFALWGLRTLGELAALPEKQLVARMGQAGRRLWLLARGEHPHLMEPAEEQLTLEERMEFDAPLDVLDSLLFVLRPMLEQLVVRANARALALASVTVKLRLTNQAAEDTAVAPDEAPTFERTVKPALPLADSRVLLKLLHLDLQAHPPGAPIVAVHLQAEPGDQTRAQLGMFSPQLPETSRLDVTLARIRALVGEDRVGRPKLLDAHAPESFTIESFAPQSRSCVAAAHSGARSSAAKQNDLLSCDSPDGFALQSEIQNALALRRLRPPVLLKLRTAEKRPRLFFWQGARYEITEAFGPWRQSGNWWTTSAWSSEEWDVIANGSSGTTLVCRIAQDVLHRNWRMEGLYD